MNIKMQCCGVILLVVLLFFYIRQKRISLNTQRAFLQAVFVTLGCILLDILSIIVLNHRDIVPDLIVKFICKSYLASLVGVALCGLLYVCVDIYTKKSDYRKKTRKYDLAAFVGMLVIYCLPIYYGYAKDGKTVLYTYGASVVSTYIFAVGLLIVNFHLMKKERDRINPLRREAVRLWMLVWMGASLIQFFHNSLLLVGYMSAIGMMILYLKLENPESNLDRQTGMFSHSALMLYIGQLLGKEQKFAAAALVLNSPLHENGHSSRNRAAYMEVLEFLLHISGALVFKNMEDEFLIVFEDADTARDSVGRIQERFQAGWGNGGRYYIKFNIIFIPDVRVVDNAEDMLFLIHNVRQNSNESAQGKLVLADRSRVEQMYRDRETEKLLERAIDEDRVEVFYQPIFSTKEGRFTSAEALVRIRDENGKIVPPGVFIGIAEQNGAILSLGKMVFEKVCRMMKENDIRKYGMHYLEINLSVVQCAYEHLAEDYIKIMEKYEVLPEQVNLEITESASLEAKAVLLQNMEKLMAYGVRFSLDDFGTGQSNLNYIVDMPVDIVKFDREMTTAYFENEKAKYVMDHAIRMIHGMGLSVVSEGIETKEQFEEMEQLGICYIQGYYFSRPLPQQEFLEFVRERNGRNERNERNERA